MSNTDPLVFSEAMQSSLQDYMNTVFVHEEETQAQIRLTTTEKGLPDIDVLPMEGQFLWWLGTLTRAERIVEIGTLAGYSASWLARALPFNGELITLESDAGHAEVARQNFEDAGIAHLITVIEGDAHRTLYELEGPFDLVFIDAEKQGYMDYLNWTLDNLRPGGIVAAHNAFQNGAVADADAQDEQVKLMKAFNERMANEPRLLSMIYPAGDGMSVGVFMP